MALRISRRAFSQDFILELKHEVHMHPAAASFIMLGDATLWVGEALLAQENWWSFLARTSKAGFARSWIPIPKFSRAKDICRTSRELQALVFCIYNFLTAD
jgi:hypothetical protein